MAAAIDKTFGSMEELRKQFSAAAAGRFGSGWAWLVVTPDKRLAVTSTPNGQPVDGPAEIAVKGTPILDLDVWEHAYYLSYQNRRDDYIKHWWDVVNWNEVNRRYEEAMR